MTIRMVHIGLGERGRHWLDFVATHPDFSTVAGIDPAPEALTRARALPAQEHGQFFAGLDALGELDADAALVASPSFLHAEHARAALDAGLAVLVEKPLGGDFEEAVGLVARARAAGRPLVVAENYRFFQAERTLRDRLDQGAIGEVGAVSCIDRRDQPSATQGAWVKTMAEPFLSEIAVHHFDSFRYLFGREPVAIRADTYDPPGSDYDGAAAVSALVEFEGGIHIQYGGTMVASRYEFGLRVEGSAGALWTDRRRVWVRPGGSRWFRPLRPVAVPAGDEARYPKAGTVSLLNQFRDAIRGTGAAETSGEDNLWTLAMVAAAKLAAQNGRRVRIDEVFTPGLRRRANPAA